MHRSKAVCSDCSEKMGLGFQEVSGAEVTRKACELSVSCSSESVAPALPLTSACAN